MEGFDVFGACDVMEGAVGLGGGLLWGTGGLVMGGCGGCGVGRMRSLGDWGRGQGRGERRDELRATGHRCYARRLENGEGGKREGTEALGEEIESRRGANDRRRESV